MDLSIEFHHPAISKIHNGMISNQLESDNTKKQLSSDRKVWKTISTESYIKPNTIQLSEKRDNEVVTKVPGIEVKSEIQSSFNFGNITFSDTNVIHHKKENRFIGIHNNNMFLTDGVKIVPHHFVKNFIENMKSRENGTTVAPPSIPNSSEYQESSTWNTPATTLLNAQTNGKTGETVTKITTDLSQTSPETETKLNITVTQNVTTKMHQTSPENTVTSSKPITSSTIINFTSRKPTNLEPSDNSTGANITKKERESTTAPFSRANDVNNKTPITTVQNPENISKTTTEFKTNDVTKTTENVTLINKVERTSPVLNNPVVYPTTSTTIVPNDDEDELGLHSSGSDVMPNNVNNTKIKDVDTIIFPSFRADIRQRRRERKKFCYRIDFGKIKKSFQCCKKTLNCFDDLPENLDETVFHHGTHEYNEPERRHVCSHIDESIKCKQTVEIKPHCKEAADILDEKIKPQMDKVKLFYYNHCNRGSPISPTLGPKSPTLAPSPPTGQGNGSEHYHSNSSNFAPFIGGAVMGVFGLIVIVLIALYCRKSTKKRKRNKEQRNDPGRESTQSSRYKTVTYERRKSEVYAEIDEKSMISSVSYALDGHSCSTDIVNLSQTSDCKGSRKYPSAPTIRQVELDNHGYLSPQSIIQEDCLKPDVIPNENNLFTHGYIELKSESGDSAQSYAKLEPEPEDEYVSPDQIQSSPSKDKKPDQRHTYFVLEKENE